jgi:hypothetical protein
MSDQEEYIWITGDDPCPVCADLDGYTGTLEEFKTRILPGIHPGCRCRLEPTGTISLSRSRPPITTRAPRRQTRCPRITTTANAVGDHPDAADPHPDSPAPDRMF